MYNKDKILQTLREIYDGSKQIEPYVVIAQPRRVKGETPAQNLNGHVGLHINLNGHSHGFVDIFGEKVDVARNYLIERALETGAKYMLFVGEDTVLPYDGFLKLHETAEANPGAIVTGVYYIKLSCAMIMVRENNMIKVPNVDPGQIIRAWQTGMDAMLIPLDVLRKMKQEEPELPFCCIANGIEDIPFIGEDNFFVHRVHKMGIPLLVDTDVQCLHMDLATGKYTAHPSVDVRKYVTNIPIAGPLTWEDREFIEKRWIDRLPEGTAAKAATLQSKIEEISTAGKPVKFNMGCGRDKIEGYIGVDKFDKTADIVADLISLDAPDGCADEILASHVIEHLTNVEGLAALNKWHSMLKAGGKLIMETPDLEAMCKDFVNASEEERYVLTFCIYGASADYVTPEKIAAGTASPHLWGFYPKVMKSLLKHVGFTDIKTMPAQGQHPGKNFRVEATK